MINSLKAEFRKLLTVRSTYFIFLISLVIVVLVAGYGNGIRVDANKLHDTGFLATEASSAVVFDGVLLAIAGLLLLAHEYRYNSILYTLTSSNSRVKSLLAKFMTVTVFTLIATTVITFFTPLCSIVGVHLADKHMVHQTFHAWSVLWKCLFVGWGYAVYAFIITAIVRSQVGSIVTYLLFPLVGEHIIESIFKNSAQYMPFNSLQSVVGDGMTQGSGSLGHNVITVGVYIALGLAVSFVLFARRDAN